MTFQADDLSAPFNDTRTLKFKTHPNIAFFTAVNLNYGNSQRNERCKTETNKTDQNLPIAADRRDLLNRLK